MDRKHNGNENRKDHEKPNKRYFKTVLLTYAIFFGSVLAIGGILSLVNFIAERMPEDVVELPERMISREKFEYAHGMNFHFQIAMDGVRRINPGLVQSVIEPFDPRFDPFYDELIFVHTEACAVDFPDNVIAAWPSEIGSQRAINSIHSVANRTAEELRIAHHAREPISSLEDFGLTYPITIADLVDNWEKVNELLWAFTYREQMSSFGLSPHRRPADAQAYEDE